LDAAIGLADGGFRRAVLFFAQQTLAPYSAQKSLQNPLFVAFTV
jgi:hypothetical protein